MDKLNQEFPLPSVVTFDDVDGGEIFLTTRMEYMAKMTIIVRIQRLTTSDKRITIIKET